MHPLLGTNDWVKYNAHFLKPNFQKLLGRCDPRPAGTQHSDGPGQDPKGLFTRAILHVAIVILVYVINSWQSMQQVICS